MMSDDTDSRRWQNTAVSVVYLLSLGRRGGGQDREGDTTQWTQQAGWTCSQVPPAGKLAKLKFNKLSTLNYKSSLNDDIQIC